MAVGPHSRITVDLLWRLLPSSSACLNLSLYNPWFNLLCSSYRIFGMGLSHFQSPLDHLDPSRCVNFLLFLELSSWRTSSVTQTDSSDWMVYITALLWRSYGRFQGQLWMHPSHSVPWGCSGSKVKEVSLGCQWTDTGTEGSTQLFTLESGTGESLSLVVSWCLFAA